jgi:hypothetical protein
MTCSKCGIEVDEVIKGLCRRCYNRAWEMNHTHRRKINTEKCSVCGDSPVVARGLCNKHYARWLRHGSTDQTRPETWGTIGKHPLYHTWSWMNRSKNVSELWRGNFRRYLADVGDKPSARHYLRQIDPELPYGPDNFIWVEKRILKEKAESDKEYARRYQRDYRKTGVRNIKNSSLKKSYGMTIDEYESLHDQQNGKCAICGEYETMKIKGITMSLAVDHCHNTGKVRGLLCHHCNKAIGAFKESTDLLLKAAAYLVRTNGAESP